MIHELTSFFRRRRSSTSRVQPGGHSISAERRPRQALIRETRPINQCLRRPAATELVASAAAAAMVTAAATVAVAPAATQPRQPKQRKQLQQQ